MNDPTAATAEPTKASEIKVFAGSGQRCPFYADVTFAGKYIGRTNRCKTQEAAVAAGERLLARAAA